MIKNLKRKCNILILFIICSMLSGCSINKADNRVWVNVISDMEPSYTRELLDEFYADHKDIVINIINKPALSAKDIVKSGKEDYDLWLGNLYADTVELSDEGYFVPYKPENMENLSEKYQDKNNIPRYTVIAAETSKIVANNELKKEINETGIMNTILNNIDDFAVMDPEKTVQGLLFIEDIYDKYGEQEASKIYKQIKQSKNSLALKNYESSRKVNRNKLKGAVVADYTAYYNVIDDFETEQYDLIKEPNYNLVSAAIIDNKGKRQEQLKAAKIFMDFLNSEKSLLYVNKYKVETINKIQPVLNKEFNDNKNKFSTDNKKEKYKKILKLYEQS